MENPRRTAAVLLVRQEKNGYANLILGTALAKSDLPPRDKAFVSALFYGTTERLLTLDFILQQFLTKPLKKLDAEVRAILRSGLYQVRYMESVPDSAAINEAVALTKKMGKTSASGMVNAVLRRAAAYRLEDAQFADDLQRLSVWYSVSVPIAQLLINQYGMEQAQAFLQACAKRSGLCVRVNTLKTTEQEIEAKFATQSVETRKSSIKNSLYVNYKGDITNTKLFKNGFLYVQGEGSALACSALNPQKHQKVVDLCAAPGGKTATLAQYMDNTGALYSCDISQGRLGLIETLLTRCEITNTTLTVNDAAVPNAAFTQADCVLCDVPCSGLGIIAKKPDIRYKTLADLNELIALQKQILETAAGYVKEGGRLVYSTCTVNKAENEEVVQAFLAGHPEFTFGTLPPLPQGAQPQDGMVCLHPHKTATDGFFVAVLERV